MNRTFFALMILARAELALACSGPNVDLTMVRIRQAVYACFALSIICVCIERQWLALKNKGATGSVLTWLSLVYISLLMNPGDADCGLLSFVCASLVSLATLLSLLCALLKRLRQ